MLFRKISDPYPQTKAAAKAISLCCSFFFSTSLSSFFMSLIPKTTQPASFISRMHCFLTNQKHTACINIVAIQDPG